MSTLAAVQAAMTFAPFGTETGAPLTVTSIISTAGAAGAASAALAARPREDAPTALATVPPDRRTAARSRAAGSMKVGERGEEKVGTLTFLRVLGGMMFSLSTSSHPTLTPLQPRRSSAAPRTAPAGRNARTTPSSITM